MVFLIQKRDEASEAAPETLFSPGPITPFERMLLLEGNGIPFRLLNAEGDRELRGVFIPKNEDGCPAFEALSLFGGLIEATRVSMTRGDGTWVDIPA